MSSEPTERQGADDNSLDDETPADGSEGEASADEERLEARAQPPNRVDDQESGGEDELVPPPSDAEASGGDEPDEEGVSESLAEETSETELEEPSESEGLAEQTSEPLAADASSEVDTDDADEPSADALAEEESEADVDEDRLDLPEFNDLEGQAAEWLDGLFERMNFDAKGDIFWEGDEPRIDISGPDADRMLGLGKLGPKAIEGIETLLQSVFSEDDAASDIYVDVDGKRAQRKEMLQDAAVQMADKAVALGEKLTVSGLNSTERRIIHRRLRDYDGVDTESVGDGIFRRLTIDPAEN